ncbi:hypothetical protein L249_5542 [Ophiocordyceps polyrhachis-furcata BCC 54312]|uniref:Uncharacterized protein n=1 Tax=Ophiocordyceps polyrhachis-furcata BCC 54312 TaxID=1330021 RepID=A0A367LG90_9HYPO|nr:hypothetical protein L249_5542 [Ophiocordyceps polyrhachis-furcata BCC 54312]
MADPRLVPLALLPPTTVLLLVLLPSRVGCALAAFASLLWLGLASVVLSRLALNPAPAVPCRGRWDRELVVVTGGAGGIGYELVRKLEDLGASVVVLDTRPSDFPLRERSMFIQADVSDRASVDAARDAIAARFGQAPTALVANAGVLRGGGDTLLDIAEADLRSTLDVNLLGVLFCVRAFMPAMVAADRGHVIVASSVAALSPAAGVVAYAASKAALTCAVQGLQTELKHRLGNPSVKISAVFPAAVRTPMFSMMDLPVPEAIMPLLEPEEVADRMVQILADGESSGDDVDDAVSDMVMMPTMASTSSWIPAMPHWMRVAIQDAGARGTARLAAAKSRAVGAAVAGACSDGEAQGAGKRGDGMINMTL